MSETTAWLDAGAKLATADGKSSAPKSAAPESQVNRSREKFPRAHSEEKTL